MYIKSGFIPSLLYNATASAEPSLLSILMLLSFLAENLKKEFAALIRGIFRKKGGKEKRVGSLSPLSVGYFLNRLRKYNEISRKKEKTRILILQADRSPSYPLFPVS